MFTVSAVSTKLDLDLYGFCEDVYSKTQHQTANKSNVNGWQSSDIKDIITNQFTDAILELAQSYKTAIHLNKELEISNVWINRSPPNSYNKEHVHPGCLFAGVYYVSVPDNSGKIKFITPAENMVYDWKDDYFDEYNEFNSDIWWLPVAENVMHIFPSWLKHDVTINRSDDVRTSISFNIVVKDS